MLASALILKIKGKCSDLNKKSRERMRGREIKGKFKNSVCAGYSNI